jgi:hypothetical protein
VWCGDLTLSVLVDGMGWARGGGETRGRDPRWRRKRSMK